MDRWMKVVSVLLTVAVLFVTLPAMSPASVANAQGNCTHVVQNGQSLSMIGQIFGASLDQMLAWNPGTSIYPGVTVNTCAPQPQLQPSPVQVPAPQQYSVTHPNQNGCTYTVQRGDTWSSVAFYATVPSTPEQVASMNGRSISSWLEAGQTISVPCLGLPAPLPSQPAAPQSVAPAQPTIPNGPAGAGAYPYGIGTPSSQQWDQFYSIKLYKKEAPAGSIMIYSAGVLQYTSYAFGEVVIAEGASAGMYGVAALAIVYAGYILVDAVMQTYLPPPITTVNGMVGVQQWAAARVASGHVGHLGQGDPGRVIQRNSLAAMFSQAMASGQGPQCWVRSNGYGAANPTYGLALVLNGVTFLSGGGNSTFMEGNIPQVQMEDYEADCRNPSGVCWQPCNWQEQQNALRLLEEAMRYYGF